MTTTRIFRNLTFTLFLLAASLTMISCTTYTTKDIAGAETTPFFAALEKEYRKLASQEGRKLDLTDKAHFAAKAAKAREGNFAGPDNPRDRDIDTDNFPRIWTAYERLTRMDDNAHTAFPRDSAAAYAMFDCWLEELEERKKAYTSGLCEARWNEAIVQLECLNGCEPDEDRPVRGRLVDSYKIHFGLNSVAVKKPAQSALEQIARQITGGNITAVRISGFTDRTGAAAYNEDLAEKRAEAVAAALKRHGVPSSLIVLRTQGERNATIPTDDEVTMEANRRVEIELFK